MNDSGCKDNEHMFIMQDFFKKISILFNGISCYFNEESLSKKNNSIFAKYYGEVVLN
jgi:hypothetical protein